ncbi:MAG TPA: alpha/beta fold hydrolase [Terrimicrobiaceae bacterium]|nr:alpha/beta fold hydrolase [Terrimicrobiaceae bacterium]
MKIPLLLALAAALSLSSCTTVKIRPVTTAALQARGHAELMTELSLPAGRLAECARKFQESESLSDSERLAVLAGVAREAQREGLASGPDADAGRKLYNACVEQIGTIVAIRINRGDLPGAAALCRSAGIALEAAPAKGILLAQCERLTPAAQIHVGGLHQRSAQDGWGSPFVASFDRSAPFLAKEPGVPRFGMILPATALLTFDGSTSRLRFLNALASDTAQIGRKRVPLAADFSDALVIMLNRWANRSIDVRSMFLSRQNFDRTGLFQLEPYDPNKIPVVLVHGLISTPGAWAQAVNQLRADPEIRKRYQFWVYLYPTGLPVWGSAAVLREELNRYQAALADRPRPELRKRLIVVGHSMGGLITSLLVREGGMKLWTQFSDEKESELPLSADARKILLRMFFFQPREDIAKVVFISTPHRGSQLASLRISTFFAKFIQLPMTPLYKYRARVFAAMRPDIRKHLTPPYNSIRFLQARNPILLAILKLPMHPGVPYHSIIGDQGKGGTPDSSDGVVPYWSSHLEGAASEKIVPSGHGANENPDGIAELKRILLAP